MLPQLKLDTDSFQSLIEEYRMQISGIYPEWTNYNYSDPGITFVELFAWMKENQQFFMEQLSPEHYRRFFKLMGLKAGKRRPAVILGQLTDSLSDDILIPAGSVFYAEDIPYTAEKEFLLPSFNIVGIETVTKPDESHIFIGRSQMDTDADIGCYPFGKEALKGSEFYIYTDRPLKPGNNYELSMILNLGSLRNPLVPGCEFTNLTTVGFEYYTESGWKKIENIVDNTHGFLFNAGIEIRTEENMKPVKIKYTDSDVYAIRAVLDSGIYDEPPLLNFLSFKCIKLK